MSSVDSNGLSDKTGEVFVRINKQCPDIVGVHVGKDVMNAGAGDQLFGYASDVHPPWQTTYGRYVAAIDMSFHAVALHFLECSFTAVALILFGCIECHCSKTHVMGF